MSNSLESMGTTFIKLGQFLATRPDIIGEELSQKLENLQDKLPPFSLLQAKEIIKNDLGEDTYNSIIDLSEPVGRKLDFLMQELNRAANTISSKSHALFTSSSSVELKVLIEQMREQIQNIE